MPSSPILPCPSCPPHAARGHGCAVYSSSLSDAEWAILEPLLPAPGSTAGRGGRPEKHCRRAIVDAILYIVRVGIAWRQLPVEFPPAGTVYAVFARWARSGVGQRMLDALRDRLRVRAGRDRCPTAGIIDARYPPPTLCPDPAAAGRRQETNGVKRHIAVAVNGLLLAVVVTAASIQDRDAAHRLLAAGCRGSFSTSGWSGPTAVTPDGCSSGRKTFSPLLCRSSNASPAPLVIHVRPPSGWSREVSRGSTSTPLRARLRNQPDHHEATASTSP